MKPWGRMWIEVWRVCTEVPTRGSVDLLIPNYSTAQRSFLLFSFFFLQIFNSE